ncbi:DUF5655 domain-containing protein [Arthrobacter sp. NPDC093128]|uniref:DUF5655 domain-containing protein n=1 Tax=Arthrobacter sp. NPDC093128 TaxID=3154979 RepID=UPI003444EC5A
MDTALDTILARPVCALVYDALLALLHGIGSFEVEPKKTSLHITHGRAFLGVHPRSNGLLINVVTAEPIEDPRIRRSERVSANRVHNELLVTTAAGVDAQLQAWIGQAYDLTK